MKKYINWLCIAVAIIFNAALPQKSLAQNAPSNASTTGRERLLMDSGWRFAFGHATDPAKDFDPANNIFQLSGQSGQWCGRGCGEF